MTERAGAAVSRSPARFAIGPSVVEWRGDTLRIAFRERTAPIPRRIEGEILIEPEAFSREGFVLDDQALHLWAPIAPRARVSFHGRDPAVTWSGEGYLDSNIGEEPLEHGFHDWSWSRAHVPGETVLFYDANCRSGARHQTCLRVLPSGAMERIDPAPSHVLPRGFWGVGRRVRSDGAPRLIKTLEDAPFYLRSAVAGAIGGRPTTIMHESLSLGRLRSPIVKAMLPFRMPRRFW
ncbi:MAG: hydratase [Alphaproteobacteria bacterium]|jgi:carotenoid 1,2-hydratase|nr:hydratase [Alphaproteobacteria bacterium]